MPTIIEDNFVLASRAFDLFTDRERKAALEHFARLRYASVEDRFFEAVHRVIRAQAAQRERS